ncbi:MAG TPA: hypothetical protein VN778_04155, partial [Verrucomicrobiae bacterium]|nr:hypothetical protein [Verrucomicrobiae bacterium]
MSATGQIVISNTQVQDITENSAMISWTTSIPTVSKVRFGLTTQYGAVASSPLLTTQHRITASSALLMS